MVSSEDREKSARIVALMIKAIKESDGKQTPPPLRDAPKEEPGPTVFDLALESLKANAGKQPSR